MVEQDGAGMTTDVGAGGHLIGTLIPDGNYCRQHGCPQVTIVRRVEEPSPSACPACCIDEARKLDAGIKSYYVALLKETLGAHTIAEITIQIQPANLFVTADERIVIGVFFKAALYGFILQRTIGDLMIDEAKKRARL